MKFTFALIFSILVTIGINTLTAQAERTIYQSLAVSDSTMQIEFDIPDPHEVIPWHHESRVVIEVSTRLENATNALLGILIREGRYELVSDKLSPVTTMRYAETQRSLIKNSRGDICKETVTVKIYIPEGFILKKNIEPKLPVEQTTASKSQ